MMRRMAALLVLAFGLTGCLETVEPEVVYRFDGITDSGEPGWEHVQFQAVFLWYEDQQIMLVGAGVDGDIYDPDQEDPPVRAWRIHSNTCDAGGAVVGQDLPSYYPDMEVNIEGEGRSEAGFNQVIDVTGAYHAKLYLSPDDDTVIACVNLTQAQA